MVSQEISDLIDSIDKVKSLESVKEQKYANRMLDTIISRIQDETFRIVVVGEFSSGKSTFINALIGKDILLHAANETTATVTYIMNVAADDERLNTCEIEFYDNSQKQTCSFDELKQWTTADSDKNVAQTIKSVTIFIDIIGFNKPLVIIDTPGLNGVADKHREITLNEVTKAHACIYVFSEKGLTNSDCRAIDILRKHQSRFIFIQNKIDRFKETEGEFVDNKIAFLKESIKNKYGEGMFNPLTVLGVSSVKALAAKDRAIKKLYWTDERNITELERESYYPQSGFERFETLLKDIIDSGEYRRIILESAKTEFNTIIEELLNECETQNEINQKLKNEDDLSKRNEIIASAIEKIKQNKDTQIKELHNYIVGMDSDFRKETKKDVDSRLKEYSEQLCSEVDDDIQTYSDYTDFEHNHGSMPNDYYASKMSEMINKYVYDELRISYSDSLNYIYQCALQRMEEYKLDVINNESSFVINMPEYIDRKSFNNLSEKEKITQKENELEMKKIENEELIKTVSDNESEIRMAQKEKSQEELSKSDITNKYNNDVTRLGQKPKIVKVKEARTRYVDRKGFFGWFAQIFCGPKEETYYVEVNDKNSERVQQQWLKDREFIERKYNEDIGKSQNVIISLEKVIDELKSSNQMAQKTINKNEATIKNLEETIKNQKEIYEKAERNYKKDLCESLKKHLKSYIYSELFDDTEFQSVKSRIIDYLETFSDNNVPKLVDAVVAKYEESLSTLLSNMEKILEQGKMEIENKYNITENDINTLSIIRQNIQGV